MWRDRVKRENLPLNVFYVVVYLVCNFLKNIFLYIGFFPLLTTNKSVFAFKCVFCLIKKIRK